jgi:hypothetical protein
MANRIASKAIPAASYDAIAIRTIDDYSHVIQGIRGGNLVWWGTITISKDGKTRTATLHWYEGGNEYTVKKIYNKG